MEYNNVLNYDTIPDIPAGPIHEDFKEILRQEVAKLVDLQNINKFPGAQPVSFELEHFGKLKQKNYMVCEKSDGIDRKNDYKYIDGRTGFVFYAPKFNEKEYLDKTIIDGELVVDKEENGRLVLRYLAFDILVYSGKIIAGRNYNTRQGYLRENVVIPFNYYAKMEGKLRQLPFQIEAKVMQRSYGMLEILKNAHFLKHKSDGLIFTSEEDPYVMGTCNTMLKWKPPNENSVDFKLQIKESEDNNKFPIFNLYIWQGGNEYSYEEEMGIVRSDMDYFKKTFGKDYLRYLNNKIVEVTYDPEHCPGKRWKFMRVRDDKKHANHSSVYTSIKKSISDNVDIDKLGVEYESMRNAYKARIGESTSGNFKSNASNGVPALTNLSTVPTTSNAVRSSLEEVIETKASMNDPILDESKFAHIVVQADEADSRDLCEEDEFHDIGAFDEALPLPQSKMSQATYNKKVKKETELNLDDGTFDASLIPSKSPSLANSNADLDKEDDFFDAIFDSVDPETNKNTVANEDSISHGTEEFGEVQDTLDHELGFERSSGSKKRAVTDDFEGTSNSKKHSG